LVQRNGWKVDDFSLESRTTQIASFRRAIPMLVASTAFADFVRFPEKMDPARFTSPGSLRDALVYARELKPFPFPTAAKPVRYAVSDDGSSADSIYADRTVRLVLSPDLGQPGRLAGVQTQTGGAWADVAQLLLLKKNVEGLASVQGWMDRLAVKPRPLTAVAVVASKPAAPPPAESSTVTTNVVATETEPAHTGVEAIATESPARSVAVAAVVKPRPASAVVRSPIRTAGYHPTPGQMTRKEMNRARKGR
jgi:hypothetical protein